MKPENKTLAVMHALGWQGGTIHQVCDVIGCDSTAFLYRDLGNISSDFMRGYNAVSLHWHNKDAFIANEQGNLEFWFGVAAGQNIIDTSKPC